MAHRSLSTLVFAGFDPTTAATVISLMGDEGMPQDLRIIQGLAIEPWQNIRTGLMIIGMDPNTDLVRVSQLIQSRTTYWDVAVCIPRVLSYYSVALLAQGAAKVLTHPEDDLEATKQELRSLLRTLANLQSDAFGLEVSDLIQLYGEKRIPKTIRLTGGGIVGSIYLHNGLVVHADTMEDEEGMKAFRRLISVQNPEIRVHKGCLTDKKTIGIPAMSALLEGSRQADEAERNSRFSGSESMDLEPDILSNAHGKKNGRASDAPVGNKVDPLRNLFSDDEIDLHQT
ncbi:hypothetical protein BH09SUM1_BH09SUM1_30000 [soil metagenome]